MDLSQANEDLFNSTAAFNKKIEELTNENNKLRLTLRHEEDQRIRLEMEQSRKSLMCQSKQYEYETPLKNVNNSD